MNSYKLKLCRLDATKVAVALIKFSFIIAIILFLSSLCHFCCIANFGFWATFIGSIVAISNALLLYATLNSQKEGLENEKDANRRERFETTLFNMLENHRKLTDEISIIATFINEEANTENKKIRGRAFFSYANREMALISKSIETNINKKYDKYETEHDIQAFEDKWDKVDAPDMMMRKKEKEKEKEWKDLINSKQIELCNYLYDISEEDRRTHFSGNSSPYTLFRRRWYVCFEHYIRNLYYILQYVYNEKCIEVEDQQKYINCIQSQMSKDELYLVETHAQSFPKFRVLLEKTHLTEILATNKI